MNALIVIDLHGNLDALELMQPFFYPLEAENRLYWVKKPRMADISSEVLSWLHKYQVSHFNIAVLTGLPLTTHNDTLTNQLYRIQRFCISPLEEQKLIPDNIYIITLDGLRRDGINGRPQDNQHVKSWEIDTQGIVNESRNDDFLFNAHHVESLNHEWKGPFDFENETIDQGLGGLSIPKQEQVRQSIASVKSALDQMINDRIECIQAYVGNDNNNDIRDLFQEKYRLIQDEFHEQLKGLEYYVGRLNNYMPGAELKLLLRQHLGLGVCCEKSILVYLEWQLVYGQIPVEKLIALTQLILLISQQRVQKEGLGRCERNSTKFYRLKTELNRVSWTYLINDWYVRLHGQLNLLNSESQQDHTIDHYPLDACHSPNLPALSSIATRPWPIPTWRKDSDESLWRAWLSDQNSLIRQRQHVVQDNIDKLCHQLNSAKNVEKKKVRDIDFEIKQANQHLQTHRELVSMEDSAVMPGSYEQLIPNDDRLLRACLKTRPSRKMVFLSLLGGILLMASAYSVGLARPVNITLGLPTILPFLSLGFVLFCVLMPVSIIRKSIDIIAKRCHTLALNLASRWSSFQEKQVDRLKALCRLKLATQNWRNIEQLDKELQKQAKLKNYHRQRLQQHKKILETIAFQLNIRLDQNMERLSNDWRNIGFDTGIPEWRGPIYWPHPDASSNAIKVNIENTNDSLNLKWVSGVTFTLTKTDLVEFGRE